ncbi:MAG: Nif3-like dinuclear metal center hexameric protein, partial [Eubacteriales bacterium]|nr:Nif3-like dinuclear metal center hexameric protein [Eubacteriales bacterium]
ELCRFERAMISAHTNVDRGIFGTATAMLSSFLGDCDLNQLVESSEVLDPWEELGGLGHGRVLSLEEPRTFVDCVKSLELSFAQPRLWAFPGYSRKPDSKLSRIAFCPGAFSEDFLPLVKKAGVEMVVSGEVKHHLQLAIHDLGCDLVMLNHDVSERVVMPIILAYLRRLFPSLNFALDRGIDYTLETSN